MSQVTATDAVGLIVGDIGNPYFAQLSRGVASAFDSRGRTCVVADCGNSPERQRTLADQLVAMGVSGLVLTVPHDAATAGRRDVPVVAIDRCAFAPYVSVDNVLGGRSAARHLIDRGYKRIGILYADPQLTPVADRRDGFRSMLSQAGMNGADFDLDCGGLDFDSAVRGAEALFDKGVDAIFAIDDVMASAVVAAAVTAERSIPADLGVVGYDDTPMAAHPALDMSSVAQDTDKIGSEAAAMLLKLMAQPNITPSPVVLPPRLVVRGSSRRSNA
jgi:DNA-binding LacI/PurR family transcriptional regulator